MCVAGIEVYSSHFLYTIFDHIGNYFHVHPNHEEVLELLKKQRYVVFIHHNISVNDFTEKYKMDSLTIYSYVYDQHLWLLSMNEPDFIFFKLISNVEFLKVYDTIEKKFI